MWAKIGMAIKNFAKGKAVEKASQMASNDDGNRMSRIVILAIPVFGILLLFIAPLIIIAQSFGNIWVIQSVDPHANKSLNGQGLPSGDEFYPLNGKKDGVDLEFFSVDDKYLTDEEMDEIDEFIKNSIDSVDDWGLRVATAGWALAYGLSEKGVKMYYSKASWASDSRTNGAIGAGPACKSRGFCHNWGLVRSHSSNVSDCGRYGHINKYDDCSPGRLDDTKYTGLDCTGFVKWSICTGCGHCIPDSVYTEDRNLFPYTDISNAEPGDVLISSGHVILFLKHNDDGTFYTVEAIPPTVVFKKLSNPGSGFHVAHMRDGYEQYCERS